MLKVVVKGRTARVYREGRFWFGTDPLGFATALKVEGRNGYWLFNPVEGSYFYDPSTGELWRLEAPYHWAPGRLRELVGKTH